MCYSVPLVSAIITTSVYLKNKDQKTWWLNLMLYGGALFGVIDHLWNGELFLISDKWLNDLLLGVVITVVILIVWGMTVLLAKKKKIFMGLSVPK